MIIIETFINVHSIMKDSEGWKSIRVFVFSLYAFKWVFDTLNSHSRHRYEKTSPLCSFFVSIQNMV